jgi:hypothetical protein
MLIKKTTHGTSETGAERSQIWSRSINIFPLASCYPDTAARSPARCFFISSRLCVKILLCLPRLYFVSFICLTFFFSLTPLAWCLAGPGYKRNLFHGSVFLSVSSRLFGASRRDDQLRCAAHETHSFDGISSSFRRNRKKSLRRLFLG